MVTGIELMMVPEIIWSMKRCLIESIIKTMFLCCYSLKIYENRSILQVICKLHTFTYSDIRRKVTNPTAFFKQLEKERREEKEKQVHSFNCNV